MLAVHMQVSHLGSCGFGPCHPAMMATGDDAIRRWAGWPARRFGVWGEFRVAPPFGYTIRPVATIIFLRHGQAEDDDGNGDAARPLTPKGVRQAEAAGRALGRLDLVPDLCLTSPRVRAAETARLACLELGLEPVVEPGLGQGGFRAERLAAAGEVVLLVGHEPTFSAEVGRLTGGSVRMRKGGLAVVRGSRLELLAGPDLLGLFG